MEGAVQLADAFDRLAGVEKATVIAVGDEHHLIIDLHTLAGPEGRVVGTASFRHIPAWNIPSPARIPTLPELALHGVEMKQKQQPSNTLLHTPYHLPDINWSTFSGRPCSLTLRPHFVLWGDFERKHHVVIHFL